MQLSCCMQNRENHQNKVTVLESQMTCIANGYVHDDNTNNSNKKSEQQTANGDQDQCPDIQYIIIDMAPVTFIDSSGSKMLERVSMSYLLVNLV